MLTLRNTNVSVVQKLSWTPESSTDRAKLSRAIVTSSHTYCWLWYDHHMPLDNIRSLLSQLEEFDFRYMVLDRAGFFHLPNWLSKLVCS